MGKITFKFEKKEIETVCYDMEEGDSILDVALDNDVHLSHNCGAVCACSTCQIYLEEGEDCFDDISEKEEDFIDRARNPRFNSRLACQCKMKEEGDIVVTVPDQGLIIGH